MNLSILFFIFTRRENNKQWTRLGLACREFITFTTNSTCRGHLPLRSVVRFANNRFSTMNFSTTEQQLHFVLWTACDRPLLRFFGPYTWIKVLALFMVIVGLIGNTLTVTVVACRKEMRTPTYTMIACLAVTDAVSLMMWYTELYTNTWYWMSKCFRVKIRGPYFDVHTVLNFAKSNAATHLCLFALIRYIAVVHPLTFQQSVTPKRVILLSVIGWLVIFIFVMIIAFISDNVEASSRYKVRLLLDVLYFIVPTTIFLTFHCLKVRALRRSPSLHNNVEHRMNIIVIIILSIFVLVALETPLIRLLILFDAMNFYVRGVGNLLFLFNCANNPVIYFIPTFLKLVRHLQCSASHVNVWDTI